MSGKLLNFLILLMAWVMAQSLGLIGPAFANQVIGPAVNPATLCLAAINFAEQAQGLPSGILHAIGVVESGRPDAASGAVQPWPWTIDANGVGHVYDSEEAAVAAAHAFQKAGVTSLDVGCLQVNLRQHPHAFADFGQAFSPAQNAFYAGRFLRELKAKLGSWPAAIAAYHSQTPSLGIPYEQRVLAAWQEGGNAPKLAFATPPFLPPGAGQAPEAGKRNAPPAKPKAAKPEAAKSAKPPAFAAGSFQFLGLRNRAPLAPMMMRATNPVAPVPQGGMHLRGLATYRAAPIPIAMVR